MTTSEGGLQLSEVTKQFVVAEERLNALTGSAQELARSSDQLAGAKDSLAATATSLNGYTENLSEVTTQLASATAVIQEIDPAAIRVDLADLRDRLDAQAQQFETLRGSQDALENAVRTEFDRAQNEHVAQTAVNEQVKRLVLGGLGLQFLILLVVLLVLMTR